MSNKLNAEEYYQLVKKVYQLIIDELENSQMPEKEQFLHSTYPKLVIMYEFFRLLRGEAFVDVRPHTPEKQQEFYQMEGTLQNKIKEAASQIDFQKPEAKYQLDEAKKSFDKFSSR